MAKEWCTSIIIDGVENSSATRRDVVREREDGDGRLADCERRRGDDRRQEAFEPLPRLGQLGRDTRAFRVNLGADMVRDKAHDPLAVGAADEAMDVRVGVLEQLAEEYAGRLTVLGAPCNQFGAQEPGSAQEIANFCDTRFHVSFPLMEKVEVNGAGALPLYRWLKAQAPGVLGTEAIKWNFTKFLVGRNGRVLGRYAPMTKPEDIARDIEAALDGRS